MLLLLDSSCNLLTIIIIKNNNIILQYYCFNISNIGNFLSKIINYCFYKLSITASQINYITVGRGPGSFLGIRTIMAYAKGFSLGKNILLNKINTFTALRYSCPIYNGKILLITSTNYKKKYLFQLFIRFNKNDTVISKINIINKKNLLLFIYKYNISIDNKNILFIKFLNNSSIQGLFKSL